MNKQVCYFVDVVTKYTICYFLKCYVTKHKNLKRLLKPETRKVFHTKRKLIFPPTVLNAWSKSPPSAITTHNNYYGTESPKIIHSKLLQLEMGDLNHES